MIVLMKGWGYNDNFLGNISTNIIWFRNRFNVISCIMMYIGKEAEKKYLKID